MSNIEPSQIIEQFSQARVLVVGDSMLDKYWQGPTARVSPEAPVPVVNITEEDVCAGGAANVALNLANLGCQTGLLSLIGDDTEGNQLDELLKIHSVKPYWAKTKRPTICKLRILSRHQQLIRLDFEDTEPNADALSDLEQQFKTALNDYSIILFSDYAKGCLDQIERLIKLAKQHNKIILVDPKGQDFQRYQSATLLTPNLSEFEAVMGTVTDEASLERKGQALIDSLDLNGLLVTRGDKGMSLIRKNQPGLHLPAHAKSVFDVTGAGDTVIATLAAVLGTHSHALEQAVQLANLAASIVVEKVGTAWVHPAELRYKISESDADHSGVCDLDTLKTRVADAKARKERIIFTNGCFDILHGGHVSYLKQAKSLGDRLVVGVNDDDSVKRLKGDARPINPIKQRLAVLAALESVDWVVPFSEDTPENLIKAVTPDCLVKGGDYREDQIVGAQWVRDHGGDVKSLSFQKGSSTTDIINNILERKGEPRVPAAQEDIRS